ncbi:MAG TPA: S1 RNA-binding domain-containing protein [Saprospiraceae bacterium]|nr:S1 RNA-binding domain-containing protein [Saprospiraceae bacterium]
MTVTVERTSSEVIDQAVSEVIMEEENNGFVRGELKPFLEKIADKYNIPFTSLRNRYYRDVKALAKPNRKALASKKTSSKEPTTKKEEVLITSKPTEKESEVKAGSTLESPTPTMEVHAPVIQKLNAIDEDIRKHNERPVERIFTSAKDHYKLNQLVDVKVLNIQSYGAFCEIMDGKGFQALCHISEIVDGFIKDVNDYFEVGQVVQKVKICLVDFKKINISTKHLRLKKREIPTITENNVLELPANPPVNNIGEKFGNLKDKLLLRVVENENKTLPNEVSSNVVFKNQQKEIDEIFDLEQLSQSQEEMLKKYEKDIFQMTSYLQEGLGALSKPAKLELATIIEEEGLFNTTRAILKTQENFKADIGLLFMQQMKNKFSEYL